MIKTRSIVSTRLNKLARGVNYRTNLRFQSIYQETVVSARVINYDTFIFSWELLRFVKFVFSSSLRLTCRVGEERGTIGWI